MRRYLYILLISTILNAELIAQNTQFSLATDIGVLRSFKKEQRFLTFGHTIQGVFHVAPKDALYVWISYYKNGKFDNDLTATAKSGLTIPQEVKYKNKASMRLRQLSMGWKRYLKGTYDNEDRYNIYGYAGLGLLFGRMTNQHSTVIDTAQYDLPVLSGEKAFKRLTLDLGLGVEQPIGNALFLYVEGRAWIPASDYPSKYLFVNDNAPVMGMINAGIRILFD
ncbi:MAG TPA: hypothetical protein VF476_14520 [Chitinophagaceae bacterium]